MSDSKEERLNRTHLNDWNRRFISKHKFKRNENSMIETSGSFTSSILSSHFILTKRPRFDIGLREEELNAIGSV